MTTRPEIDRPSSFARDVLEVMTRYLSPPTARSLLDLALKRQSLSIALFRGEQLEGVSNHLRDGMTLFVSKPAQIGECMTSLQRLAGGFKPETEPAPDVVEVVLRAEDDIVRARIAGRTVSLRAGFSEVARTRVVTAVSELARNIVRYAHEGTITFSTVPGANGRTLVQFVAEDRGPGIADLEAVLAGTYKSQHGMGLGLRGVKRVAEYFTIQTAPKRGTTVHVRIGGV